ncbi:hypothetical protein U3A55_11955 [Salarchaeum sp. III]|uniref:hypothetical protein n=1 Tax=Salarchaeum sp. III TaxID=3107927 RepID=UPI002EDAFBA2
MPSTFTTSLPDAQQPSLGNGVEDEIAVNRETTPTNNGQVRVQIRETGQSEWDASAVGFSEQTVAYDTTATVFVGREDGEEYEVRARSETEHVTGNWTSPISIVTKFPGVTNLQVTSTGTTSVGLSGQDNADNEDGIDIVREERIGGEWQNATVVAELGPQSGTGSFEVVDDSAHPDRTYRYRARPFTEDTEAFSAWTNTVETDALSTDQDRRARSNGWYVEVERPDGTILTPQVLDNEPERQPSANSLPEIRIPVPQSEKWQDPGFEGAPLRVWYNGRRQPIDELVDIEDEQGPSGAQTMLVGQGALELQERVQREVTQDTVTDLVQNIITTDTNYTADVDDTTGTVTEDVLLQAADDTQEFVDAIPPGELDQQPVQAVDGGLELLQSAFTVEAEDYDAASGNVYYSAGFTGIQLQEVGDYVEYTVSVDYTIPESAVAVQVFKRAYDNGPEITASLNGSTWTVIPDDAGLTDGWADFAPNPYGTGGSYSGGALSPGTYTLRLEATTSASNAFLVDALSPVLDNRLSYTFATTRDENGALPGPEHYRVLDVVTDDAVSSQSVVAGEFTGVFSSTGGSQAVAVSNDQGQTYPVSAANASSVSGSFAEPGGSLRARITLSGHGSSTSTPSQGVEGMRVESYDLSADLSSTPLVLNRSFDGSILEVLQELSRIGEGVFGALPDGDGGYRVAWTTPGGRPSDQAVAVSAYEASKTTRNQRDAAVVKGANQSVVDERWTTSLGTPVPLTHDRLLEGSVSVYDPSSGTQYTRGEDFEVDHSAGELTALSSGSLEGGVEYAVSYEWQTYGEYTRPDAPESPSTYVAQDVGATTNRACGQAARRIVTVLSRPRYSATVTVPAAEVGWDVLSALSLDPLPFDDTEYVQVRDVSARPGSAQIQLRSDGGAGSVLDDLQERVRALAGRS